MSLGPDAFIGEFYQTFKRFNTYPFQTLEEKGMLSNSFYKANNTLIPKPDKDSKKEKITGQYL